MGSLVWCLLVYTIPPSLGHCPGFPACSPRLLVVQGRGPRGRILLYRFPFRIGYLPITPTYPKHLILQPDKATSILQDSRIYHGICTCQIRLLRRDPRCKPAWKWPVCTHRWAGSVSRRNPRGWMPPEAGIGMFDPGNEPTLPSGNQCSIGHLSAITDWRRIQPSEDPQLLHGYVPGLGGLSRSDNDMIEHVNPHQPACLDEPVGQGEILFRGCRISRRMIVGQ